MANHLASETSPYLLQHVNNPVDWYPWGAEALSRSRELDRPIFLSIGYSACHWCHVMEHESFENSDIAALMNDWFVCIKVDREERPDLDQIYMTAVQVMTGSGGWPMSVFLTPELKPFYGGTYWPPTARWGRPGFREILSGVHDAWVNRRTTVDQQAEELTEHLQQFSAPMTGTTTLNENVLHGAAISITRKADRVNGGFGSAPKFPHPMDLRLALRCFHRFESDKRNNHDAEQIKQLTSDLLNVVTLTLEKMARGGIYDHLGGGFARYSTDERWLVPHFEKMLYDNAQLVPAYLEAFQITGRRDFAEVARETLDYVLREMTQPQGGFYSTQDADSEGVEGKFFVWSEAEIDKVLSEPAFDSRALRAFKLVYDVSRHGNWEHSNILNRVRTDEQAAKELGLDPAELERMLAACRRKLFEVRSQRIWPGRDEKVLASWNGLMIAAMSMSANVLQEPRFAQAARAAADFVLHQMSQKTTERSIRLLHCYKDGKARFNGYLDDYAAMIDGLCELYQAVFDSKYLDAAASLAEQMIEQFWDSQGGGFFYISSDHETLITRIKETQDNATPSGNSLAVMGLLKLSRLTGRMEFEDKAVATLEMMSGQLERVPLAAGLSLMALDFWLGPAHEIVVAEGKPDADDQVAPVGNDGVPKALAALHQRFVPNKVIHWRPNHVTDEALPDVIQATLAGKRPVNDETTAYVCERGVCRAPIAGQGQVTNLLEQLT